VLKDNVHLFTSENVKNYNKIQNYLIWNIGLDLTSKPPVRYSWGWTDIGRDGKQTKVLTLCSVRVEFVLARFGFCPISKYWFESEARTVQTLQTVQTRKVEFSFWRCVIVKLALILYLLSTRQWHGDGQRSKTVVTDVFTVVMVKYCFVTVVLAGDSCNVMIFQ